MKDYEDYNDYELLYMINEQDEIAYNLIHEKYKSYVVKMAKKYINNYDNYGLDINDFILEGYIGLETAIENYVKYDQVSFPKFLNTCMKRRMLKLVKDARLKRNEILNNSLYYEEFNSATDKTFLENIEDTMAINPAEKVIFSEFKNSIFNDLISKLSKTEYKVFMLKISGLKATEISEKLNMPIKSVNNAISRIYNKYKKNSDK